MSVKLASTDGWDVVLDIPFPSKTEREHCHGCGRLIGSKRVEIVQRQGVELVRGQVVPIVWLIGSDHLRSDCFSPQGPLSRCPHSSGQLALTSLVES